MTNGNGNGNGNGGHAAAAAPDGLSTSWLATRLGIQSARVDAMRRSGELLGVPVPNGRGYVFPGWQFGRDGKPLPALQALVRTARAGGVDETQLSRILAMRAGLTGGRRVVDELRDGNDRPALRALFAAA